MSDLATKADLAAAAHALCGELRGVRGGLIRAIAIMLVVHAVSIVGMTVALVRLLA